VVNFEQTRFGLGWNHHVGSVWIAGPLLPPICLVGDGRDDLLRSVIY